MKKILYFFVIIPFLGFSQVQVTKSAKYSVHEDRVMPSKVAEYESLIKELVQLLKQHNIADADWLTSVTNDFRYFYVSPIENIGSLDKNVFASLTEKVGKDKMDNLWNRMNTCYTQHGNYILNMDHSLSYQPQGIDQNPAGKEWREYHYWYFAPSNASAAEKKAAEIKALCESKKSPLHYRIYRSGFGTMDAFYLVAFAASDGIEFEKNFAEHRRLLGDEGKKLVGELRSLALKYEEVEGMIRPDLSYRPITKPEMRETK